MKFKDIDAERKRQGRTISEFCRTAGVSRSTYKFHKAGAHAVNRFTLKSYLRALEGRARVPSRRLFDQNDAQRIIAAAFRAAAHALCGELGADPEKVLAADPGQRATAAPEWMEAARVRALTVACVAMATNLPAARIAAAIGVTRAGASAMQHRAEDLWEKDAALEALVKRVAKSVAGEDILW